MTTNPKVSVILPTYNDIDYLPHAIESMMRQTMPDFELIIINDGSTDGTETYLKNLVDPRISVISQENRRLPASLNVGIQAASCELVTWISSDNYCAPYFLEAFLNAFAKYPSTSFACSAFAWIDNSHQIISVTRNQNTSPAFLLTANPGLASFMYRKSCHDTVGWYDQDLEGAEDWDMWLRISETGNILYLEEILYYYRTHDRSMTATIPARIRSSCQKAFTKGLMRRKNMISVKKEYCIKECSRTEEAMLMAHMGSRFLKSPFEASEYAFSLLDEAKDIIPDNRCIYYNLLVSALRTNRMEVAFNTAQKFASTDPGFQTLCDIIVSGNRDAIDQLLSQLPIMDISLTAELLSKQMGAFKYSFTANRPAPKC